MNAIIYCRYSPRPHESDSIQSQAADLQTWCQEHGHDVRMVCFDPDTSGTVAFYDRPGLATALTCLQRGDLFVVRNLNRAARAVGVGLAIEEEIERIGAQLAATENGGVQATKSTDRNAWCMRVIHYLMSDMQRMEICERTSRRMLQHQASGRAMGGAAPYGWTIRDGELVPDPDEQRTIAYVRELSKQGATPSEIATRLRRKGISPRGARWHSNTVRRILKRSERYGGTQQKTPSGS